MIEALTKLCAQAKACTLCKAHLPSGPRPVFQVHPNARILVAGQAPGRRVHESGVPFDDPSGTRLRAWLGVDAATFYDETKFAILPMGFCYPGTGKFGDLPPRAECAPAWRPQMLALLPNIQLSLAIGQYAIAWHLGQNRAGTLTQTVLNWRSFRPEILALPHPSPRNNIWLKKNAWFEEQVVPDLQKQVALLLN